ncbi:hypothetical protein PQZ60_gp08 [Klebsiella phage vB_KpnM_FZ14]|nr:hypothetical protein PQZ60_gp08 [Klebsiella phage vB_KpnM_FZ14]
MTFYSPQLDIINSIVNRDHKQIDLNGS